jgi:hypothetical protein
MRQRGMLAILVLVVNEDEVELALWAGRKARDA